MYLEHNDDSKEGIPLKDKTKCLKRTRKCCQLCHSLPDSPAALSLPATLCLLDQQSGMMPLPENPLLSLWGLGCYPAVRADGCELPQWHLPPLPICEHGMFL